MSDHHDDDDDDDSETSSSNGKKRKRTVPLSRRIQQRLVERARHMDFASLPEPVKELLMQTLSFREIQNVCETSALAALLLCGIVTDEAAAYSVSDALFFYQTFQIRLQIDFGLAYTESECAAPTQPLKELVTESLRRYAPIAFAENEPRRSNFETLRALRRLYVRLYNSVASPFSLHPFTTENGYVEFVTYEHGGIVMLFYVDTSGEEVGHYFLTSIVTLHSALEAERPDADDLYAGVFGPTLTLVDVEQPARNAHLVHFVRVAPGVYRSNLDEYGELVNARQGRPVEEASAQDYHETEDYDEGAVDILHEDTLDAVYALPNEGLQRFRVLQTYSKSNTLTRRIMPRSVELDQKNEVILMTERIVNTSPLLRVANTPTHKTTLLRVTKHFKSAVPITQTESVFIEFGHTYVPEAIPTADALVLHVFEPFGRRLVQTFQIEYLTLTRLFELPRSARHDNTVLFGKTLYKVNATDFAWRFAIVIWPEYMRMPNDMTRVVVIRIDCDQRGVPRVAIGYNVILPSSQFFVSTMIGESVLPFYMIGKEHTPAYTVLFDTESGDLVQFTALSSCSWLHPTAEQPQSKTHLSIFTRQFDNGAGMMRDAVFEERERVPGVILEML